jgi:hypothetical protein
MYMPEYGAYLYFNTGGKSICNEHFRITVNNYFKNTLIASNQSVNLYAD